MEVDNNPMPSEKPVEESEPTDEPMNESVDEPSPVSGPSATAENSSSEGSEDENDGDPDPAIANDFLNYTFEQPPEKKVDQQTKHAVKRRFKRSATSQLPSHLKGLMGEANLRVARGEFETAAKMCYEVIRQYPTASEPYLTLAEIYSAHPQISAEYQNIASHLIPKDASHWVLLAESHVQAEHFKDAVVCYSKAITLKPKKVDLHMKRIDLLEMLGDSKSALRCKTRLAYILKRSKFPLIIQLATEVAQEYLANNNYAKAAEAMSIPLKRCKNKVTPKVINRMLDALLLNKDYSRCLDIFVEHCDIQIEVVIGENNEINVLSYQMPESIQIDLRIRFLICLIKLDAKTLVPELIDNLLTEGGVESIGDLYLDVAEACMSMDWPEEALKLLVPLVKSCNFSLAAVWLKHAECLEACDLKEQAIDSYLKVTELAPLHIEARHPLVKLLLEFKRYEEALKVAIQDTNTGEIDIKLLIQKMEILKNLERYDEYFADAELLLLRHCTKIQYPEEIKAVTFLQPPKEKIARIKKSREFRGEIFNEEPPYRGINEPTVEAEFQYFKGILELCKNLKKYTIMQRFAFTALSSTRFKNRLEELNLLAFFSCLYSQDTFHGYPLIRDFVVHHRQNHLCWNLFNMFLQRSDDIRYNRFMIRLLRQFRSEPDLILFEANYSITGGNYWYGLQKYMKIFHVSQSAFLSFMMGVLVLNCYCQRDFEDGERCTMLLQALFKHYANKRGLEGKQEIHYNLGRMYHMIGMMHLAVFHYKEALKTTNSLIEEYPNILDLKQEAAYNLHVIYKSSGNNIAARKVLMDYIVI